MTAQPEKPKKQIRFNSYKKGIPVRFKAYEETDNILNVCRESLLIKGETAEHCWIVV